MSLDLWIVGSLDFGTFGLLDLLMVGFCFLLFCSGILGSGWLSGVLTDWLAGWLPAWLAGWLAGVLTD